MVRALLLDKKGQSPAPVKAVEESCVTCGGNFSQGNTGYRPPMMSNQIRPPGFPPAPAYQAPAPQTQRVSKDDFLAYVKSNDVVMRNMQTQGQNMQNQLTNLIDLITKFMNSNTASTSNSGTLPSNTIANPRSDLKAITTRSGVSYDRPQIPPPPSSLPLVVENKPEATKDTVDSTNNEKTEDEDVQPQAIHPKPVTSPISEPAITPVSASRPNPKASIPYPSRRNDESNRERVKDQIEKFYQIFKDMSFEISFADALILMPKFTSTLKALIKNKEKLSEMARTPLNEHCFTVLLKKLPEKLGDPGKFLIPCDFPCMAECLALADLGVSINLMPYSIWKWLSLSNLTPTCMMLELADRSITSPFGIAEDVYVKTERALIDVFKGELTLRVGKEAITFNLDQTSRYSTNYSDMMAKRIDVIDMACEEYSQEVLGDFEPAVQHQRMVNPKIYDVIKQEVIKLLEAGLIYPISDSPWVSPMHCVPKKGGFTIVENEDNELIPTRLMLERLAGNQYYCFLDGFFGYFQIPIDPKDQEKTTFTCPYGTFAYRRMPFGQCNAPCTFHRCMMAIFHVMIEKTMELFMDDFSVFGNSFQSCLSHLDQMLKRCEDTNLCLNWKKSHFMVKEGIVLGHKISKQWIEVDKAKIDVITKLPHPTIVKGIRSFLGYAGFYRRFIKDFSKIARPMTRILEKDAPFIFSPECVDAFRTLKTKLCEAPILIAPNWDMPFELMCDAGDFAIGAVLGQQGDILLLEAFLNDDPSSPSLNKRNYLLEVRKELKICKAKTDKSSVDEPPMVELKALPPHLEYAFLEGDDKLHVIITKYLSVEEKTALITVLKSHKRATTWKLSDIKGINPEFYTHKILMEEDFTPAVQHQRRVNPKIHDVIKQKVIKLLDAGLIYPISDSPWVCPVHCVPKKGGITVVENEDNELIPTCLVTGWRVCIDYRKLNEATRKDHFPLPFIDKMLERLAGNQYYCFLDGFSGYF
nr:reverse transcriptase domain-containing protein [Tanacetum cinerariifolium]